MGGIRWALIFNKRDKSVRYRFKVDRMHIESKTANS